MEKEPEWMAQGYCRINKVPSEVFFPLPINAKLRSLENRIIAVNACSQCQVMLECREYAVVNTEYGFWGNTDEEDRQAIRTARGINRGGKRTNALHLTDEEAIARRRRKLREAQTAYKRTRRKSGDNDC